MTNAQKWVTIFLVLFILLLVLSKLTKREESSTESTSTEETMQNGETQQISAENLIAKNKCASCHGRDLNGSGMGPSLINLSTNWEKDDLVSYLQNPSSFLSSARMAMLKDKYGQDMPAFKNMSAEELDALASFLLDIK
ncbi:MAG: cytochrome c [Bacteroidetes bacterium]|nr:cytochrome c [Bacteroidota bacterium]MBU1116763.1 cytochrome c [Bacteroidota bacterium]MBU1798848.1 cytochrome c [Bacteroidota bacterium]